MQKYARISDGVVVELFQTADDIAELFHESLVWIACDDSVAVGWLYANDAFAPPPAPPAPTKEALIAYAASERYRKEVGGVLFYGVPIATDDRSKQMILGARVAATAEPQFSTNWVAADGSIVALDAESIVALSNAVLAHVDGCFSIFASVVSDVNAETITTIEDVAAAFA